MTKAVIINMVSVDMFVVVCFYVFIIEERGERKEEREMYWALK